jgi:hypothetical protein
MFEALNVHEPDTLLRADAAAKFNAGFVNDAVGDGRRGFALRRRGSPTSSRALLRKSSLLASIAFSPGIALKAN